MNKLYKFGRVVCEIFVKIAYRLEINGLDNLPDDRNFILCSNHRTYLDPVFLGLRIKPELNFMAKEELFKKPVLGFIIKKLGAFPVGRGKGDTKALDTAVETIRSGRVLAIFPEGTRSKTGELKRFKSGAVMVAAKTGADIVPAAISFKKKLRFRTHVVLTFGEIIKNEELKIEGIEPSQLKFAGKLLQQSVQKLLDEGNSRL